MPIALNLIIFFCTALAYLSCFHTEAGWDRKTGFGALRYYTLLSNLFCALAALALGLALIGGDVPHWIWLWKYIGTAAVTVTLLTVLVFLGPAMGYKALLSGRDLYLHLIGPLLAIVSFCFFEKRPMGFGTALAGMLPVLLYGPLYLYKIRYAPEGRRWDDFYGFNKNGKWPLSCACMLAGTFLICLALMRLQNI